MVEGVFPRFGSFGGELLLGLDLDGGINNT